MNNLLGVAVTAAVLALAWSEPLCLKGDFSSQLQQLLDAYMLTPQEQSYIISTVEDDILHTLNKRWQGIKMIPYGSLTTGLGTQSSDLDFSMIMQHYNSSLSAEWEMLDEINRLVTQEPELYSEINYSTKAVFARYSFTHSTTHRKVDLIFRVGDAGVQNSKVIRYYFHLDDRFVRLGGLLKLTFKIHDMVGRDVLKNYALYLLIIFYLQQKNLVPAGYVLQRDAVSHYVGEWDTGFNELPYNTSNTETVYQLMGGFFKYYSQFDFDKYVVSTFAGRPIPKSDFLDIDTFPEEFTRYENNTKFDLQLKIKNNLKPNTYICIQDTFVHDMNNGELIKRKYAAKLKRFLKSAARWFEDVPADRFLSVILSKGQHGDGGSSHYKATQHDCIEIPDADE